MCSFRFDTMYSKTIFILLIITLASCAFSKKIKDGEMAYERKQYAVAATLLEDEYLTSRNEISRGRKAFLLGQCYRKLQDFNESLDWFGKAVKHEYGAEALGNFASVSKILENYNGAIATYQTLINTTGRKQEFDREILLCKQAIQNKQKASEYKLERIFENSTVSDYSPVIYESDFLVFTSEREDATGKAVYNWTGEKFSDIFIIQKNGSDVKKFDSAINTTQNEGTPWFSKNMETMYFTRCYTFSNGDDRCKIMRSRRINEVWEEPIVLPFIQDKYNYSQPTLIENDSVLVFTADIEEASGPTDLYYTELLEDGSWAAPEKLPGSINTQGFEKFPTGDGDTLYFSSDYLPGFGGYDIFKTYLRKDFTWAPPVNLGYGINSGGDEFSYIIDYNAKPKAGVLLQGYFTTSKPGSGKDDIYKFSKFTPDVEKPLIDTIPYKEINTIAKSLFITVRTYTPEFSVTNDPNSEVIGKTALPSTSIRILDSNGTKLAEGYSDDKGFYYNELVEGKDLKVLGSKLNYLTASTNLTTKNIIYKENETTKTISVELLLDKMYENKEINLKNIYYDYDQWFIKEEAKPTLNQLAVILNDNPRIKIQLSSHTDCRGTDEYNVILSQKRAQSVVDYLITKGIDKQRLIAVGYGESFLVDKCICENCTEDQHQTNRRTTFKIVN